MNVNNCNKKRLVIRFKMLRHSKSNDEAFPIQVSEIKISHIPQQKPTYFYIFAIVLKQH